MENKRRVAAFKRRKQARFNQEHKSPQYYGDEGQMMLLSPEYTWSHAAELFKEHFEADSSESWPENAEVYKVGVTVGPNEDGIADYYVGNPSDANDILWEAWGVTVYE